MAETGDGRVPGQGGWTGQLAVALQVLPEQWDGDHLNDGHVREDCATGNNLSRGPSGDSSSAVYLGAYTLGCLARLQQLHRPAQHRMGFELGQESGKLGAGACRQLLQPELFSFAEWPELGNRVVGLGLEPDEQLRLPGERQVPPAGPALSRRRNALRCAAPGCRHAAAAPVPAYESLSQGPVSGLEASAARALDAIPVVGTDEAGLGPAERAGPNTDRGRDGRSVIVVVHTR